MSDESSVVFNPANGHYYQAVSDNDILVAGNELSGVNLLEGGVGSDTIVASGAKDLFFVRLGDDSGYGAISGSTSTAQEQVIDFQLSGDSAKFVGRDNLVKDEFLFVSDSTSLVTAGFDNVTKTLSISLGSNSYNVAVDIKTESGTSTTSYYDDITQRTVDYKVSAFVVQGQLTINNAPDLSVELLAGSTYSSVLADTAQSVTRVGLLRQRLGELIDTAGIADAVVGGRDDDIIVLSGKGSDIKGDIAIGGQGLDLYEVRMVSDLRNANAPPSGPAPTNLPYGHRRAQSNFYRIVKHHTTQEVDHTRRDGQDYPDFM
jgi:hypothetical protein